MPVPTSKEDWIANAGAVLAIQFAGGQNPTSPAWANSLWAAAGVTLPPEGAFGTTNTQMGGKAGNSVPGLGTAMESLATYLFNNPSAAAGIFGLPGGAGSLPSSATIEPPTVTVAKIEAAGALQRQQISSAAGLQGAQLQASASMAGSAASAQSNIAAAQIGAAAQIEAAKIRAEVDREATAAQVGIAAGDRASREAIAGRQIASTEGIAAADRRESGRQFDLRIAEDRRQYNSTMIFNLFDRAVSLAKAPVDWLAHQYFMENLDVPLTYLNINAFASVLGAIPPTGPSQIGPVVGGPAIIDGEIVLAATLQIPEQSLGAVSVAQAVQANPGESQTSGAAATLQQITQTTGVTPEQLDRQLAGARVESLKEIATTSPNTYVQKAIQDAQQVMATPPAVPQQTPAQLPELGTVTASPRPEGTAPATPFTTLTGASVTPEAPAQAPATAATPAAAPAASTAPPIVPVSTAAPAAVEAQPPAATPTPDETRGIYTGATAPAAAAAVAPAATPAPPVPVAAAAPAPLPAGGPDITQWLQGLKPGSAGYAAVLADMRNIYPELAPPEALAPAGATAGPGGQGAIIDGNFYPNMTVADATRQVIPGLAQGGLSREPAAVVGDPQQGNQANPEMLLNPTHAPISVVPLNRVEQMPMIPHWALGSDAQSIVTNLTPTTSQANPQGELLLQQLSAALGIPIEDLRKVVPVSLLAGGYSKETIAASPAVQALQQGRQQMSAFRTAPVAGTPFATLQAWGIPLGIRGGQDINSQLLTKSNPSTVDQLQGTVEAAGLSWSDTQKQVERTSPWTTLPVGSRGQRTF